MSYMLTMVSSFAVIAISYLLSPSPFVAVMASVYASMIIAFGIISVLP